MQVGQKNPAMDERMRLYLLGELAEIQPDLRHMNSGRLEVYNEFFEEATKVLQDWQAEDSRRHGVAHLSKAISVRDLHAEISSRCSEGVKIPSLEWLRLQFMPANPVASSAVHYSG
eukprot:scpid113166/ scgid12305/ 